MPPFIERYILLSYCGRNYEFHNLENSDTNAIRNAVYKLEKRLGKMRGGLMKHFKNNPDDILVVMK